LIAAQDTRQEVVKAFRVRFSGTTIIIDRKGRVIFRDEKVSTYADLKRALEFGF